MPVALHGLTFGELQDAMSAGGDPAFRARQLWQWLYVQRATDWSAMVNLPRALRMRMASRYSLAAVIEQNRQLASDGAGKLLLSLADGETVETAVIPAARRRTVCVSSQAGCRFRCAFCASGQSGFRRHLDAAEIVGQVLAAARVFEAAPTHLVFMGIGEPLDNPEALERTLRIVNHSEGLAIGARRITISTCGVIPGIRRLAQFPMQVELSVSLHAPDDALRSELMPVNRKYPITDLLAECRRYYQTTGRLITFEYTLIGGCNDSAGQARKLVERLRTFPARVNLIPLSPVAEFSGKPSSLAAQKGFMRILEQAGINTTLRASRGAGVAAACGQLRTHLQATTADASERACPPAETSSDRAIKSWCG